MGPTFIHATLIEVSQNGTTKGRGEFEFLQLPAPGDRVVISNEKGGIDILRVLYIEHHPVQIPTPLYARDDATATVFAEWIDDEQ